MKSGTVCGAMACGWLIAATLTVGSLAPARAGVGCRAELDRGVLPAGREETAVIKITMEPGRSRQAHQRPPVNLSIVLDRSGSMAGEKLEKAKDAAIEALRRLDGQDIFSLVIYDHNVETLVPAQSARNSEWIEGRIREIRAGGNTALFGGVSQGAAEVRKHLGDDYVQRIILLSDGLANVGPSSPDDLERLGASLIKEGISVSTVGVGLDYNEDLMTRLAQKSDGNSYFVRESRDLPRIFAAELGDVLNVVARKVILTIEFLDGVRPLRILGRDGRVGSHSVEIALNQLYGGQEKYALIEVAVPPAPAQSERRVAVARLAYEDAVTQEAEKTEATALVKFSEREEDVVQSVNGAVQDDYARNVIAVTKDEVVELMDQGKKDVALQKLRQVNTDLQQQRAKYNMPAQNAEMKQMAQEAEVLGDKGMDRDMRKTYRNDSYIIRSQQQE